MKPRYLDNRLVQPVARELYRQYLEEFDDEYPHRNLSWEDFVGEAKKVLVVIQTEADTWPDEPCKWFRWVGQPFTSCDQCGQPATSHEGLSLAGKGPFSGKTRHRLWWPGEAQALCDSAPPPKPKLVGPTDQERK